MAVYTTSGNTSPNKLTIVLKIHGKDWFTAFNATNLTNSTQHVFTLFNGRHKIGIRALSNRHIVKIPCPAATFFNNQIKEFFGRNTLGILARITGGRSIQQTIFVH